MLKQRFRQWWYDERLITVIVLGICIPLMLLAVANSGGNKGPIERSQAPATAATG